MARVDEGLAAATRSFIATRIRKNLYPARWEFFDNTAIAAMGDGPRK